jgi:trk system potassium uptake protein TrkH
MTSFTLNDTIIDRKIEELSMSLIQNFKKFKLKPAHLFILGFMSIILFGSLLLSLPMASQNGFSVGFLNALFTATSAVCVTGLVVVDTADHWTLFGQLTILTLIQIGGLGFMTVTTLIALLLGRKISLSRRLVIQESLSALTLSGVVRLTRAVIIMTFSIEAVGALFLSFRFIPLLGTTKGIYYSIFHAVSAFCNAGFDIMGNFTSLTIFVDDYIVNLTIISLIVVGGIGFSVLLDLNAKRNWKTLTLHSKIALMATFLLIVIPFTLILIAEWNNPLTLKNLSLDGKILGAAFTAVTPRTAGFNTIDMSNLHHTTMLLVILLMFIGGSPGSTAGGIKTTTFALVLFTIYSVTQGQEDTTVFNRRLSRNVINRSLAIIGIALGIIMLVMMLLSATEPHADFISIMFETFSALGTVGLSIGLTSTLSSAGKVIILLTMFIGRLGVMTIAFALAKKQLKTSASIRYPEEKVMVG